MEMGVVVAGERVLVRKDGVGDPGQLHVYFMGATADHFP